MKVTMVFTIPIGLLETFMALNRFLDILPSTIRRETTIDALENIREAEPFA